MRDPRIYMYSEWIFIGWRCWSLGVDWEDKDVEVFLGPWMLRLVCD